MYVLRRENSEYQSSKQKYLPEAITINIEYSSISNSFTMLRFSHRSLRQSSTTYTIKVLNFILFNVFILFKISLFTIAGVVNKVNGYPPDKKNVCRFPIF